MLDVSEKCLHTNNHPDLNFQHDEISASAPLPVVHQRHGPGDHGGGLLGLGLPDDGGRGRGEVVRDMLADQVYGDPEHWSRSAEYHPAFRTI